MKKSKKFLYDLKIRTITKQQKIKEEVEIIHPNLSDNEKAEIAALQYLASILVDAYFDSLEYDEKHKREE